jgi:hypothetical protein
VALGRTWTTNNARKQGIIIIEWRFMCKNHRKGMNHLFLHCVVALELLSMKFAYLVFPG